MQQLRAGGMGLTLDVAAAAFLREVPNSNTAKSDGIVLRALAAEFAGEPVAALDGEAGADRVAAWFASRWCSSSAPATSSVRLDGLRSATGWWREQGWIVGDPCRRIRRRKRTPDRSRSLERAGVEALLTRPDIALRERTLWRLLYESAARAEEALGLDVADLDLRNRSARVRRKGGAANLIVWRTATARLLPGCSTVARLARCSSPSAAPGSSCPRPTSTRRPVGLDCPTGVPPNRSSTPPSTRAARGRCTSCAPAR